MGHARFYQGAGIAAGLLTAAWVAVDPALAPPEEYSIDKILHILSFAVLTIGCRLSGVQIPVTGLAGGLAVFGAMIEGIQAFIPHREASLGDEAANVLGILVGLGLLAVFSRWKNLPFARRKEQEALCLPEAAFHGTESPPQSRWPAGVCRDKRESTTGVTGIF